MTSKYFGSKIEPACSYCRFGSPTVDGRMILCEKTGIVSPSFSCKRFRYDPLKRVPSPQAVLPEYDSSEFKI